MNFYKIIVFFQNNLIKILENICNNILYYNLSIIKQCNNIYIIWKHYVHLLFLIIIDSIEELYHILFYLHFIIFYLYLFLLRFNFFYD